MNTMRFTIYLIAFFMLLVPRLFAEISNPVEDYLTQHRWYSDFDEVNYPDDILYQFDIDLNHDGRKWTFVTMGRIRDGQQGNVWTIYLRGPSGFELIEPEPSTNNRIEFHVDGFYDGYIDEVGHYGMVSMMHGGGGGGWVAAYYVENGVLKAKDIGEYSSTPSGRRLKDKYYGEDGNKLSKIRTQEIPVKSLAAKYHLKLESKTYQETLKER